MSEDRGLKTFSSRNKHFVYLFLKNTHQVVAQFVDQIRSPSHIITWPKSTSRSNSLGSLTRKCVFWLSLQPQTPFLIYIATPCTSLIKFISTYVNILLDLDETKLVKLINSLYIVYGRKKFSNRARWWSETPVAIEDPWRSNWHTSRFSVFLYR